MNVPLSSLSSEDRVKVLSGMGTCVDSSQSFSALFALAKLRPTMMRIISSNSVLPLIETKKLYVRESYTDLYKHIKQNLFQDNPLKNRLVITGTSGIGKSAFLLYLILQLFVESTSNSPIIIFHSEKWYAFGGTTALRVGNREDFEPFLRLPDAWYLADSPSEPLMEDVKARTLFSVSPNTFNSENPYYKVLQKRGIPQYYMAPWDLEELQNCREYAFPSLKANIVESLYTKIGGVPRYVLEIAANARKDNIEEAFQRIQEAIDNTNDVSKLVLHYWKT